MTEPGRTGSIASGPHGAGSVASGPTGTTSAGMGPVGTGPASAAESAHAHAAEPTAESAPDWSRIAAEQGYADQAHLSRQVRRWSGMTPSELAARTD